MIRRDGMPPYYVPPDYGFNSPESCPGRATALGATPHVGFGHPSSWWRAISTKLA